MKRFLLTAAALISTTSSLVSSTAKAEVSELCTIVIYDAAKISREDVWKSILAIPRPAFPSGATAGIQFDARTLNGTFTAVMADQKKAPTDYTIVLKTNPDSIMDIQIVDAKFKTLLTDQSTRDFEHPGALPRAGLPVETKLTNGQSYLRSCMTIIPQY